MKVVVTGGAGFIGANLCKALARAGEPVSQVVALDSLSTGSLSNLHGLDTVEFVQGDILDTELVADVAMGAESVIHLAARPSVSKSLRDPFRSHQTNATGTVSVLEAMRRVGVSHLIIASSSSVYGANPTMPKREDLKPSPRSPYAASKLAAESYALAYQESFGFDVLAFRFFNVFGPLQRADHAYAAAIPAFISAALEERPLPIHGDGRQTRDFTYVDSVAEVIVDAVRRRAKSSEPVNLAFGSRVALVRVIEELESIVGRALEREYLPPRAGDVRDSQADQSRLRALFPDVDPVEFSEGLRRTVEWFGKQTFTAGTTS